MRIMKYVPVILLLIIFANLTILWVEVDVHWIIKAVYTAASLVQWILVILKGVDAEGGNGRLVKLNRAINTLYIVGISAAIDAIIVLLWLMKTESGAAIKITGIIVPMIGLAAVLYSSMIHLIINSRQIRIKRYLLFMLFWWVPIANIFLVRDFYRTAVREYIEESDRMELENSRKSSKVCQTKYPILLVHGIFFRDWQYFNYWGRIPKVLERNGAKVFYGKQQSSLAIADSAQEVKEAIEKVLAETGAEKVNIIAHSKGGLDSRYAISCLGMDKYVATLTTINTPHKGCDMVDFLLKRVPDGIVKILERDYNYTFHKLGDESPDFLAGVHDLSAEKAKTYDELMPDSPEVSYRSIMTLMSNADSARFLPLKVGYLIINKLNGPNDGLVWEGSAQHGEKYTLLRSAGDRGISHGDIADLMRDNIHDFDVREFYVKLVSELKEQGF